MKTVLVTGGSGFFGRILKARLIELGVQCVNIDLQPDPDEDPLLFPYQGDLRDHDLMGEIFSKYKFDTVFHCASLLAHGVSHNLKGQQDVWDSNTESTREVAEFSKQNGVKNLVYLSTNCLWGKSMDRPVLETDTPDPIEVYGKSKWESEKILKSYSSSFDISVLRVPTVVSEDRLGLLAILFEFILEGRTIWTVGPGDNRYQFIYSQDLVNACLLAVEKNKPSSYEIFNIGSDDVKTLKEVFQYVVTNAKSVSKIRAFPKKPMIALMKLAHRMRLSPLGPYHYKMIGENFSFDTRKAKKVLGWKPTLTNEEMLCLAYSYYKENYQDIIGRINVSAHRRPTSMKAIRLLKWLS